MRRRQVMAWGATAALVLIGGAGWFTTSELQRIHAEGNGGGGLHLKLPEPDSRAGARHGSTTFRRSHSPPQSTTPPTAGTLDHMMYWDRRAGSPIQAGSKEWAPATRQGKYLLMCGECVGQRETFPPCLMEAMSRELLAACAASPASTCMQCIRNPPF
jgi:hypothetical protein